MYSTIVLAASGWEGQSTGVAQLNVIQEGTNLSNGTFTIKVRDNGTHYEAFRIKYNGNVGIGITDPIAKLHVYQNDTADDTTAGMTIEQDGTGDAALSFLLTGTKRWRMGIDNSDADKFKISSSTNLATDNKVTIDVDGNVGIGQTGPSFKLDVNGTGYYSDLLRVDEPVYSYTDSGTKHYTHLATGSLYGAGNSAMIVTTNIPGHNQSGNGNMFSFNLVGYGYAGLGMIDMTIGVYAGENNYYSASWTGTCQTNWIDDIYVYTDTNGKVAFQIGAVTDSLVCEIAATNFVQGFGNVNADYSKGWTITSAATLPTQSNLTSVPYKAILPDVYEDVTFHDKVGIGTTDPQSKLQVDGGIQMADDTDTASATKVGTMRYRTGTEYVEVDGVELVTNGNFSSGQTGWDFQTGWAVSNGGATVSTAGVTGRVSQTLSYVANISTATKFKYRFEITNITAGSLRLFVNKPTFTQIANVNAVGVYEYVVEVSAGSNGIFYLYSTSSGGNTFQGTVTNVSVVEVTEEDASYADMCMQTGASTYEWVNIVRNTY